MGYIYNITNMINGKGYIGQTIRPIQERLREHRTKSGCRAFYGAIKKHGWKNFKVDWYECPDDELNKHEKWMINLMRTLSPNGYNLKEGGGNCGKMSEESKKHMREINLGKTLSDEHKQKIGEANLGKQKSDETKQKSREAKLGENNPMYGKTGEKHHKSIRVYQYTLDGTFIDSFGSTREAARQLEKTVTPIRDCARGKYKIAYNFKWSYTFPFM